MTQPETADYRTLPPPIAPTTTAWQAWWEDHDTWDGDMLYADLDTAKRHSVHAYVGEEYSWMPGDDPDDEAPETVLTWELKYGRWRLLDGGQDTGVRLGETRTFAAPAGVVPAPDESWPSRRAGLRDALRRAACEAEGFAWDSDMLEPDEYGDHADAVLAVLYREWPWLRVEAEEAAVLPASVDRADVLRWAADLIDRTQWNEGCDGVGCCADTPQAAAALLRRVAAETPTEVHGEDEAWGAPDEDDHSCAEAGCSGEPTAAPPAGGVRQPKEADRLAHVGGNAEDCPACHGSNPPYPFICPGPDGSAS